MENTYSFKSLQDIREILFNNISKNGDCDRLHVGCVIINHDAPGKILSYGSNISCIDTKAHECNPNGCHDIIHAEMVCLFDFIKNHNLDNSIMIVTHEPCLNCAKHIVYSKLISQLIFCNPYESKSSGGSGVKLLLNSGIDVRTWFS